MMKYRPDSAVTVICIHYSATPIEKSFTANDIENMHRRRGFISIGYHYYIRRDGLVQPGRDMSKPGEWQQGAHCRGSNATSIGICCEGGVTSSAPNVGFDSRTPAQRKSQIALIRDLLVRFPGAQVIGHMDMPNASTQCPGFDATAWWDRVSATPASTPAQNPIAAIIAAFFAIFGKAKS